MTAGLAAASVTGRQAAVMAAAAPKTEMYNRLAPVYDGLHRQFLRFAGGKAQAVLEGSVITLLRPGDQVLDAGCGTGRLADQMISTQPRCDMTLLDPAPAMLRRCDKSNVRRVFGSLAALPFADATFDLTICAWALETVPDEMSGFSELVRVTNSGGHMVLALCTANESRNPFDLLARRSVNLFGTGRFLDIDAILEGLDQSEFADVRVLARYGVVSALLIRKQ